MEAHFLNVDLEIQSTAKLDPLIKAMGERVLILHRGPGTLKRHLLTVEIWQHLDPDTTIHGLCELVEGLPPACRRIWNRAIKEFDVGIEQWPTERCSRFSLRPDTLLRLAALGANLTVTVYRRDASEARM